MGRKGNGHQWKATIGSCGEIISAAQVNLSYLTNEYKQYRGNLKMQLFAC